MQIKEIKYVLSETDEKYALTMVRALCGDNSDNTAIETLETFDNVDIYTYAVERAMSAFNAAVSIGNANDIENTVELDRDAVTGCIIPMAAGFAQEIMDTQNAPISSMSEGGDSVSFSTKRYSTDITSYKAILSRYKRLRTI